METNKGFSLVEVVVAVGVFVAGVVAAVALLSQTTSSASERLERAAAERVASSTKALMETLSWEQVIARASTGDAWFANRDGSLIDLIDVVATEQRFFELTLERDEARFPVGAEATAAHADLWLICAWPTQSSDGAAVLAQNQTIVRSRVVILR